LNGAIRTATGLATISLLACGGAALAAEGMDASWSNTLQLGTQDGATKIKFGGRLQNDWVFQAEDDDLAAAGIQGEDGTEFRRLRLYSQGVVNRVAVYKIQFDFAGGSANLKDAYIGLQKIPGLGTVTVGHQYEPLGLEEQTSSKYLTFLERSLTSTFTPERQTGILATNHSEALTWAAGVFREGNAFGKSPGDGEYAGTARLVFRPVTSESGDRLVHLGVAGSFRTPPGHEVEYDSRPENHLAPEYIGTGGTALDGVTTDDVTLFGGEAALVQGPVSLQGEYIAARLSTMDNADPAFAALYVTGSFFLTGEHRTYKASSATFDRIKPASTFDGEGGTGAWELAARFSRADLNDGGVTGGELNDVTVALNWYPNPNFRWMANYVRADLDEVGASNAFLMRFQADF
jgi:phosphate-selective porin OprO/OprP